MTAPGAMASVGLDRRHATMSDTEDRVDETIHQVNFPQGYDCETEMFIGELFGLDRNDKVK